MRSSHVRYYSGVLKCVRCHNSFLAPKTPILQRNALKSDQVNNKSNPFIKYIQSLKWVPIPLGVGFGYIAYQQYGHIVKREERTIQQAKDPEELVAKEWQVKVYKALPLKAMSRLWGRINRVDLPEWLRPPVLKTYIWAFSCNMEEAAVRDLQHYKNLGEFFRRRLRPGCRPIHQQSDVTSPADGRVLHFGQVDRGLVEQVKGVTYTLQGFLGPADWKDADDDNQHSSSGNHPSEPLHAQLQPADVAYHNLVKMKDDTDLYHCVIYLAPGDYHGFHSPAQWSVQYRRHFPGELLSVNPGIARWVQGLFNLNERAVYMGEWQHGFFCMAAVGATNVGSIRVYHDQNLTTNVAGGAPSEHIDQCFSYSDTNGIPMKKGESFGEFNLGSTIVLVFEAPKSFQFNLKDGQKVKFGEALGKIE